MFFWIVNFFLFMLYLIICKKTEKNKAFLWISFCHLCIISGFRDVKVGSDTLYYAKAYKYLSTHANLYHHAMRSSKIFVWYIKQCAKIYDHYNGYIIASSIPMLAIVFYFIYKYSKNYYISVYLFIFLYFYFNSMNTSRQYFAMAMTLLVFYFSDIKKYWIAIAVGVVAVGVHSATMPCVLMCIILSLAEWNSAFTLLFVLLIPFAKLLIPFAFDLFVRLMPQYYWLKKELLTENFISQGRSSMLYSFYGVITIIISLYWLYWTCGRVKVITFRGEVKGKITKMSHEIQIWQRMVALVSISTMLYLFFSKIILFNRMASILYFFIIVLLSNVIENIEGRHKVIALMILAPLIPFTYLQIQSGIAGVNDYHFFALMTTK